MDKREMIERALAPHIIKSFDYDGNEMRDLDPEILAEQAIVIECEVEHIESPAGDATRVRYWHDSRYYEGMLLDEIHGEPGKYIFFGLPLGEEDGTP